MTDRLSIYNGALTKISERLLNSLSENREPRRILDHVWDNGGIKRCLEAGQWSFAVRSLGISYSPSIEPQYGYLYAFEEPDDYIRLVGVSDNPSGMPAMDNYEYSNQLFFASREIIYIRYVSSDNAYGMDFSSWPETFREYVEYYFAHQICPKLANSESRTDKIAERMRNALVQALGNDSQRGPSKRMPSGSWTNARMGYRSNFRRER